MLRTLLIATALTATLLPTTSPEADSAAELTDPIDQLAWLAGSWSGAALGGEAEEVWSLPAADSMIGMFRLIQDGRIVVTEFVTIEARGEEITYRFKHFDLALDSWEDEALSFTLTEAEDGFAAFVANERHEGKPSRIVYRRVPEGLDITVENWEGSAPMRFALAGGPLVSLK